MKHKILNKIIVDILQIENFKISDSREHLGKLNSFLKVYWSDKGSNDFLVDAILFEIRWQIPKSKLKKTFSYGIQDDPIENQENNTFICRFELLSPHSDVFKFLWNIDQFGKYFELGQYNLCKQPVRSFTNKNRK